MQAMNAQLVAQNKLMMEQMVHQAAPSQPQPGRLPSQPELNPRGEVKSITLRSGTQYEGPAMPTDRAAMHVDRVTLTRATSPPEEENLGRIESTRPAVSIENPVNANHTTNTRAASKEPDSQKRRRAEKPPPYRPPVPFPQRITESRLDEQFAKFFQVLKQLHVNIPFTDALTQVPTYAKFLKDILTNKRSLGEHEKVKLIE